METYTQIATRNTGQTLGFTKTINSTTSEDLVTLAEVKSYMGIEHSDDDALIQRLIEMAIDLSERYTGLVLYRRTLTIEYTQYASAVLLPWPPHVSIDAVRTKTLGEETTLTSDEYFITGQDQKTLHLKNAVSYEGLEVDLTTGYGASDLPDAIAIAIMKTALSQYEDRNNVAGVTVSTMPNDAKSILNMFRRRSI